MSQKKKRTELAFCKFFHELTFFTDAAKKLIPHFMAEQAQICIREAFLIAQERKIGNGPIEVTNSHVTEAINAIKARHPIEEGNASIIKYDVAIYISGLITETAFNYSSFSEHPIIKTVIMAVGISITIFAFAYKYFFDINYKKLK